MTRQFSLCDYAGTCPRGRSFVTADRGEKVRPLFVRAVPFREMFPFGNERRVRWCNDDDDDDEEVRRAISKIRREHANTACQLDELVGLLRVELGFLINRECCLRLAGRTCEFFTRMQSGNNEP